MTKSKVMTNIPSSIDSAITYLNGLKRKFYETNDPMVRGIIVKTVMQMADQDYPNVIGLDHLVNMALDEMIQDVQAIDFEA